MGRGGEWQSLFSSMGTVEAENRRRQDKELSQWLVEVRYSLLGRSGQSTRVEGAQSGVVRLLSADSFLGRVGVSVNLGRYLCLIIGKGESSLESLLGFRSSSSSISELSHPKWR